MTVVYSPCVSGTARSFKVMLFLTVRAVNLLMKGKHENLKDVVSADGLKSLADLHQREGRQTHACSALWLLRSGM